jgi:nucleoside-diphosphate-sugar epimerase
LQRGVVKDDSVHVLITGAVGMIGRKLTARLVADGNVGGRTIERMTLADVAADDDVPGGADGQVEAVATDLAAPGEAERLVEGRPDVIFHLAAVVSGEAEADFDKGYRVNLDGTRALLDAVRAAHLADGYHPRLVVTSSIAVYGAPLPQPIPEDFVQAPLTSYGTQKAIGELLLADYSRRGFFDGIGIRLPTICVRPGTPNRAASGFFSGIIREPLAGQEAILPVPRSVRHWFASPRAAIGFLLHAAQLDTAQLGARRSLSMPGISATVGEEIEALRRVAGERAVRLIREQPDPAIMRIVEGWPRNFDARRAAALGFRADASFDDIIRSHIEDELTPRPA